MSTRSIHLSHVLGHIGLIAVIALFCMYVLWQARFLITGPEITLTELPNVVQNSREIIIGGTATNITAITINDRPIVTDEIGNFRQSIILENGYTIVSIKAEDRYGRETVIEQPFVFLPKTLLN